jgi:IMP dehydrogenase/GMP reductase
MKNTIARWACGMALTVAVASLGGCGAQPGKTIVTQGANAAPVMVTAPQSGTYKLYTSMSPNPTTTVRLQSGDKLGFTRDDQGRLVAVGGDTMQPLGKGTAQAYWKLQK